MNMKNAIITAADGNATAVGIITDKKDRKWYEEEGNKLMNEMQSYKVEQVGFLIQTDNHFEMSGGEFCGNAARAAAMLFSRLQNQNKINFTMSGYTGIVSANVSWISNTKAYVTCIFTDLPSEPRSVLLNNGTKAIVVDMGGIVHVIIEGPMPKDYEVQHRIITQELHLNERSAVGVDWIVSGSDYVLMHPVVWVKSINTFFYESSCGSGSIAVAVATKKTDIKQPSGKIIFVFIDGNSTALSSDMEITHEQE